MVGNLSLHTWHRSGQQPPTFSPNLLSLLFCTAALFTANVSFDLVSTVVLEVAFLAFIEVFENLSKCWGFHYMLFIITLSTLNKYISKVSLESDKKHGNLFPCPFIRLEMPRKAWCTPLYVREDNDRMRNINLGCYGDWGALSLRHLSRKSVYL